MEPIAMRTHPSLTYRPEFQAKQYIIDCGNGYGLSVVNAKSGGGYHGLYCTDDTFEVAPVRFQTDTPANPANPFNYELALDEVGEYADPLGYLTIEQVGVVAHSMREKGIKGFTI